MTETEKLCKFCQSWTENEVECDGAGSCSHPLFRYCADVGLESTPVNGLGYIDGEEYYAYFVTGPEFGCIHFQKRIVDQSEKKDKPVAAPEPEPYPGNPDFLEII